MNNAFVLGAVAAFAVMASATFSQPEPQRVAFQERAMRVPVLLEKLSAQTGVDLAADPEFRNEVVFVHVKDLPLDELLAHIAHVTSGTWQSTPEGKRLAVDPAARARELEGFAEERRALVELELEQLKESIESAKQREANRPPPTNPGFDLWSSSGSAALEVVAAVPLKTLISVAEGERVVFATRPNSLQTPMPEPVKAALENFVEQGRLQLEKIRSESESPKTRPLSPWQENPTSIDNMILVIERQLGEPNSDVIIIIRARFYDADGSFLGSETLQGLWLDTRPLREQGFQQDFSLPRIEIPFSERSVELQKALAPWIGRQYEPQEFAESAFEMILDPEKYEPHGFSNSDALRGYASALNRNIVAGLNDRFSVLWTPNSFFSYPRAPMRAVSIHTLDQTIAREFEEFDRESPVIVLKPKFAEAYRNSRTDRAELRELISRSWPDLDVPFEALIEYASRNPEPAPNLIVTPIIGRVLPAIQNARGSWHKLRLLASMSSETRSKLLAGEGLVLRDLPAKDLELIQKFAFASQYHVVPDMNPGEFIEFDWFDEEMFWMKTNQLDREPTMVLAGGIDLSGAIWARLFTGTGVSFIDERNIAGPERAAARENRLAGAIWFYTRGSTVALSSTFDRVRLGEMTSLVIYVPLNSKAGIFTRLERFNIPPDAKVYKLDQLPEPIATRVTTAITKYREMIRQAQAEQQRTLPATPPRP